ncbi:malate synthase A [Longimicrobium terrae]|uniref:Malate synthase n=1 Tax=Longimicrobium terrae TaxID=1639882 RepID=A0A841H2N4_9BACT|nr:malate synthase A [Longimicrobium terrae]MBB4637722.1 malate synthase [Longimicrobium terrae]MBB6072119.1 malate synthase [Longimicrobium terrae]NNC29799.1 malate synthase A [Longimicrobium terrae]
MAAGTELAGEQEQEQAQGVQVLADGNGIGAHVLTPQALQFVADLHRRFNPVRMELLSERDRRQAWLDEDGDPGFLEETAHVREGGWKVAPCPPDLQDRRVEITGPTDAKMVINALNSGASCFMADFEDALSPTWTNVLQGQANLMDAVRRTLSLDAGGKQYRLNEQTAVLMVRPRGWHLTERHVMVDGTPVSASLFDFGLYFFHNARELVDRGTGPYFYLPKLESHREARLWNDVFNAAQDALGIPRGTIRATVLIETILAAFEMDEILYELRDHSAGLNAGRWDYIFSIIKKFRNRGDFVLPDRVQVTMTVPFMKCYAELLVRTCHRRGAHAMGGMAAFIPSRRDAEVNERALAKVREDKSREAGQGFDGTWVAHPDLVAVARAEFDKVLGDRPNQTDKPLEEVNVAASALLETGIVGGQVTEEGARLNVNVALQYIEAWLQGNGAVGIHNLMEDAATAEISRAQLWQWIRHRTPILNDGDGDGFFTPDDYTRIRDAEVDALRAGREDARHLEAACRLLDDLVLNAEFTAFLTLPAYALLD